jgi:hypothetical protein
MRQIIFKFSNRAWYTFITIGILLLIGVGVYAYGGTQPSVVGHTFGEIQPPTGCTSNQVLQWSGSAWRCATLSGGGGITTETDPTVLASVKDGVSWDEVTNKPAGLTIPCNWNGEVTIATQTVWGSSCGVNCCGGGYTCTSSGCQQQSTVYTKANCDGTKIISITQNTVDNGCLCHGTCQFYI